MTRVVVVSWSGAVDEERLNWLSEAGIAPTVVQPSGMGFLKLLQAESPDALVIDLDRLPAQGRDLALAVRQRKATRHIPLALIGGQAARVAGFRDVLPDVVFGSWPEVAEAVRTAIARQPAEPTVPGSLFDAYRGRPLAAKLGVGPGTRLALFAAPEGFATTLGKLPEGVEVVSDPEGPFDVGMWFVGSPADLGAGVGVMAERIGQASLWIVWAKKTSPLAAGVTQAAVREAGLAAGLVDYKICAVSEDFSGLLFTRRRERRGETSGRRGVRS